MKSLFSIEFDFQQAIKRAEELEDIAADMRKLADEELETSLQSLSVAWKGEAANAYLNKGTRLRDKILKSASDLIKTASTIRRVAKRTYDAEKRAYQIAMERMYEK
mgnify:CR=1 FL=1